MTKTNLDRRDFIASLAAGSLLAMSQRSAADERRSVGPNDTIRIGMVGPGARGSQLLAECLEHGKQFGAQVAAVCDIWEPRRAAAASTVEQAHGAKPKIYRRLEPLLDDGQIDVIVIATPDHQHAKMLEMALAADKDVYCEKPFATALPEAQATLAAAAQSGRVIQIGTQRRSYPQYRAAAALMRDGAIGDVFKVDLINNAYSPYRWATSPAELAAVNERDLDWQAFLMGKPHRPFDARVFRSFRLFREFSSGLIDQWMTHAIDVVHMLTGQMYPTSVMAHGGIYRYHDYRENPDTIDVALEYGQGEKKFLVNYSATLGGKAGSGWRLLGSKGCLEVEYAWTISPDTGAKPDVGGNPLTGDPKAMHHMANWLDCVRRGDPGGVYCSAEAGYSHAVACIMASEAYWSGRRMLYDPHERKIRSA